MINYILRLKKCKALSVNVVVIDSVQRGCFTATLNQTEVKWIYPRECFTLFYAQKTKCLHMHMSLYISALQWQRPSLWSVQLFPVWVTFLGRALEQSQSVSLSLSYNTKTFITHPSLINVDSDNAYSLF